MATWIKLHRRLREHWLWDSPRYLKWWIDLIMLAEWQQRKRRFGTKLVQIERGQLVASVRFLRSRWADRDAILHKYTRPSERTIRNFLRLLQKDEMITIDNTKLPKATTVITICNYERYQSFSGTPYNGSDNGEYNGDDYGIDNGIDNGTGNGDDNGSDNKEKNNRIIERVETEESVDVVVARAKEKFLSSEAFSIFCMNQRLDAETVKALADESAAQVTMLRIGQKCESKDLSTHFINTLNRKAEARRAEQRRESADAKVEARRLGNVGRTKAEASEELLRAALSPTGWRTISGGDPFN